MTVSTDRIEKTMVLRAPVEKVFRALEDASTFGAWFGVAFDGPFVVGQRVGGKIVPTVADPEIAAKQKHLEGMPVEFFIERVEPPLHFSFRWHPFAIDPAVDYSAEPMTLVSFDLTPVPEGTRLVVVESGFDSIPLARRADAFEADEEGWGFMLEVFAKFLASG